MSGMDFLRQGETPYDGFLYAAVGEDRGGNTVSVLSTLARLGLDPWDEAADPADLPRAAARNRLERLLGRFGDVPALLQDHPTIISRQIDLLPKATSRPAGQGVVPPRALGAPGPGPVIALLMIVLLIIVLFPAQSLVFGAASPGN